MRGERPVTAACAVVLILLGGFPGTAAGQASSASERRAIDRAGRLADAGRSAEAREALASFLRDHPLALDALGALVDLAEDEGVPAEPLPYAEAAAAAAPEEPRALRMWIDALLAAGRGDSALAVSGRWLERTPGSAPARSARAAALLARGDTARAAAVLEEAPEVDAEILERLADLRLRGGDGAALAGTWVRLLGLDPPEIGIVAVGLGAGDDAAGDRGGALVEALSDAPAEPRRAGALAALRAGLDGVARELAEGAADGADEEVADFLRSYAREAGEMGSASEIAWAARRLVPLSPRPVDRMRWQALAADRALAVGDTGAARRAFEELSREAAPGDGAHDLASRRLFSLLAADPASLGEAEDRLARYRDQYPDSTLAAAGMFGELAVGHARAGAIDEGERTLRAGRAWLPLGAWGPLDAAGAELALLAGDADSVLARSARSLSEPGLTPERHTERLRLLTLAQSADASEVVLVGRAARGLLTDPGAFDPGPALRELAAQPPSTGRPTALAYLADVAAEAGRGDVAAGLRRRVADAFPRSPEAPAALLALARAAPPEEAASWLERLIVGYPESALAPIARRILLELNREGP